ncbi:MAG TPA: F0F1 ATP synthase subunit B [Verrucomicrobiae bacterium]|jgi:F-type H+-transporting ATPase subunit b|nr:F0F1 ATP synthase subunit B [Verrucomicrobiae bacterium]
MNHLVLFGGIGSDLVDTGKSIAQEFGLDWPHFIAQVISFCIVAVLLYFFAYKRVLTILEERRQRIADGLANAEKIKAELHRTEANRLEVLNQANTQANKLIEEARGAAARVREEETQKAIAAAEQIITKAREAAAADHARMLAELKREVGRLVVQTTATVTGKILTPEDQKRLAEETAKQIG